MSGKTSRKEWAYKPLHVVGFETITRGGRLTRLRSQGGNARDVVCALRKQLRKEKNSEFVGAVVIGLSSKYDLLYEVGRESVRTALKIGWWQSHELRQIVASEEVRKPKPRVYVPDILVESGIWLRQNGRYEARMWDRQSRTYSCFGTYDTLEEAIRAKLEGRHLTSHTGLVNAKLSA